LHTTRHISILPILVFPMPLSPGMSTLPSVGVMRALGGWCVLGLGVRVVVIYISNAHIAIRIVATNGRILTCPPRSERAAISDTNLRIGAAASAITSGPHIEGIASIPRLIASSRLTLKRARLDGSDKLLYRHDTDFIWQRWTRCYLCSRLHRRATDIFDLFWMPAFTTFDAAIRYRRGKMEYSVNVMNALDNKYFVSAVDDTQVYPGSPINVSATIRYRF
jgi:hypothetical protein